MTDPGTRFGAWTVSLDPTRERALARCQYGTIRQIAVDAIMSGASTGFEAGDFAVRRLLNEMKAESRPVCSHCKAVLGRAEKVCFACGEPVLTVTSVKVVEGDLVELSSRHSGQREFPEWERRRFFSELLGYAEGKGYASGWAAHQYKQKFKHWPDGFERVAMSPSVSTRNWVKSRQIAFAKPRRAG